MGQFRRTAVDNKPLTFRDFLAVDYTPEMPDEISYAAHKRKRGTIGEESEDTSEALDFAQRRKRSISLKKNKRKLAMGRKKAERKAATKDRLMKRARRQAINHMYDKLAKGKSRDDLSSARKQGIEKKIETQKGKVDRVAQKLLRKVRQDERERRSSK